VNSQQAKQILLLYRPGDSELEPEMDAALRQVKDDPDLQIWFERHCVFQTAARQKFRQIRPPEGLREKILAESPVVSKVVWWRKPAFLGPALAAAAGLAVLLSFIALRVNPPAQADFSAYRDKMVSRVLREYTMDLETANADEIRKYIASNGGLAEFSLTGPLENTARKGCGLLSWHGRPVTMVCFEAGRRELFLFVTRGADLPGAPPEQQPEFAQVKKLMTASWTAGDKTYVLAGKGDEQFLRSFL
jgi:hypothetical protein